MKTEYAGLCVIIGLLIFMVGCSAQGNNPIAPCGAGESASADNHYTWGLWQFTADPEAQTLEITPLRAGNFHLNALPFLEPPPLVNLTLESLKFTGNLIDADIGLRHPFLGLTEFTGFDVCGIFITNGSVTGFSDPALRMAGSGDTRLLNPDGYSRWWNPAEFPHGNTISSYKDGLLGTPDSTADYNSTVNAYKYFCDDLGPNDTLDKVTLPKRGMFSAGQKNIRHYKIELGDAGLVFNYAVDACWKFPGGGPPWKAPDDFTPDANRSEAWRIAMHEVENTLYNDGSASGGGLKLNIDVYDWFNAGLNTVRVESPGNFAKVDSTTVVGGGEGFSTYEVEITSATPAPNEIDLLISIISDEADFGGFITGTNTTAYFTANALVSGTAPAQVHWELDAGGLIEDNASMNDISPALAWETDGHLRCFFNADTVAFGSSRYAWQRSRRSDDGGQTWIDAKLCGTHGGSHMNDHTKILAADNGNSFALQALAAGPSDPPGFDDPRYEAGRSGDQALSWNYANMFIRYSDCGELICGADGYVHIFGDEYNSIPNNGIYQKIGNQKYTFFYDWSAWVPPPDPPPNWWWVDVPPHLVLPAPAHLSNTRSVGTDSTGTIYLAYWGGIGNEFIKIAKSTDGATGLTWEALPLFSGTGYSNVRDPGLDIGANNRVHLAFLRHNNSTNKEEICYTYSTNGGGSWTPINVVYTTSNALTDTPVVAYEAFGVYVVAICFEEDDSVYFLSSFDAGSTWSVPVLVSYEGASSDKMPDMIEGTDNNLHFAFSHMGASDRELHFRNAKLVEN
jgi:hypothetical protein